MNMQIQQHTVAIKGKIESILSLFLQWYLAMMTRKERKGISFDWFMGCQEGDFHIVFSGKSRGYSTTRIIARGSFIGETVTFSPNFPKGFWFVNKEYMPLLENFFQMMKFKIVKNQEEGK